jgi:hypothetical protein
MARTDDDVNGSASCMPDISAPIRPLSFAIFNLTSHLGLGNTLLDSRSTANRGT